MNERSGKTRSLTSKNMRVSMVSSIVGMNTRVCHKYGLLRVGKPISRTLVYENTYLQNWMLNMSANLGMCRYLKRGVLGSLYLTLHIFRIALF